MRTIGPGTVHGLALAAAVMLVPTGAQAATHFVQHGTWAASGAFATASVDTGFVEPGDYDVKFISDFNISKIQVTSYHLYHAHEETYDGEVLYDDVAEGFFGPAEITAGRPGFVFPLTQDPTRYFYRPDFFGYTYTKNALFFDLWASPEAIGQPYTFSVTEVPEPAAWGLMVAGFAVGGAVLRRRPRQAPAARTAVAS